MLVAKSSPKICNNRNFDSRDRQNKS
jgi:hypothetical protein